MRLLLAGGGTGGHVFPALAIASELSRRDAHSDILFVGTRAGLEAKLVPQNGYAIEFIEVKALKGVGMGARIKAFAMLPQSLIQSWRIIRRFRPNVVLGVGGFASGPIVLTARLLGTPTVLAESNAIAGFTNRLLGQIAHVVCVAHQAAANQFASTKVRVTGNPVRLALAHAEPRPPSPHAPLCIVVLGGSRGAHRLNELASRALIDLAHSGTAITIAHQTGEADCELIRMRYSDASVDASVHPFIDDMASCYRAADLVIARAGATTMAELAVVGCPAVLVPYPFAADDHQWANACVLRDAGAALAFRQDALTEKVLADVLRGLLAEPERRARMACAMKKLARPDAAARIVDECEHLTGEVPGA